MIDSDDLYGLMEVGNDLSTALGTGNVNGRTIFRPAWQQQRRPVAARSVTTTTALLISSPMVLQDD
jgi:hypothetical protein